MRDYSQFGPLHVDWHGDESISTSWPTPESIPARSSVGDLFDRFPADPGKARDEIERLLSNRRQELENDYRRYNNLREQGSEALSPSDIDICAQGNAAKALGQSLALKTNHISYGHRLVQEYEKYLAGEIEGLEIQLGLF